SGRRQRAGDRQTDRYVGGEHLFGKELAGFAQSRRIVREVGPVDQFGHGLLAVDAARIDTLTFEKPASLVGRVFDATLLAVLGGQLLLRLGAGGGCFAVSGRFEAAAIATAPTLPVGAGAVVFTSLCHRLCERHGPRRLLDLRVARRQFYPAICTR